VSRLLNLLRAVVHEELRTRRTSALAVVTGAFPHTSADDDNNYEVDVRLKHENLTLRRVPVAAGHPGQAATPAAGDLVLIEFVDADVNRPLVTGRFYSAGQRPPLYFGGDLVWEHRLPDSQGINQLRFSRSGSILLGWHVSDVTEDSSVAETSIRIDGTDGTVHVAFQGTPVLDLSADGVVVHGQLTVQNKSGSTVIDGNTIEGQASSGG
jgi:uncharacterized protein involved in type VI secretion and phage assembly